MGNKLPKECNTLVSTGSQGKIYKCTKNGVEHYKKVFTSKKDAKRESDGYSILNKISTLQRFINENGESEEKFYEVDPEHPTSVNIPFHKRYQDLDEYMKSTFDEYTYPLSVAANRELSSTLTQKPGVILLDANKRNGFKNYMYYQVVTKILDVGDELITFVEKEVEHEGKPRHCDLHPANIMVLRDTIDHNPPDTNIKIIDFDKVAEGKCFNESRWQSKKYWDIRGELCSKISESKLCRAKTNQIQTGATTVRDRSVVGFNPDIKFLRRNLQLLIIFLFYFMNKYFKKTETLDQIPGSTTIDIPPIKVDFKKMQKEDKALWTKETKKTNEVYRLATASLHKKLLYKVTQLEIKEGGENAYYKELERLLDELYDETKEKRAKEKIYKEKSHDDLVLDQKIQTRNEGLKKKFTELSPYLKRIQTDTDDSYLLRTTKASWEFIKSQIKSICDKYQFPFETENLKELKLSQLLQPDVATS